MLDKIANILSIKPITISRYLFLNYKKFNITDSELIFLIYLLQTDDVFNPKIISQEMGLKLSEIMELISSLKGKGILNLGIKKGNVKFEVIDFEPLYKKMAFFITSETKNIESSLYGVLEAEFGRTLSPMEYEIVNAWLDGGFSDELIILALKEAIYNGATNLRYIDKILHDWKKKGYKSKHDVENRKNYVPKNKTNSETFDYDWLNDSNE